MNVCIHIYACFSFVCSFVCVNRAISALNGRSCFKLCTLFAILSSMVVVHLQEERLHACCVIGVNCCNKPLICNNIIINQDEEIKTTF